MTKREDELSNKILGLAIEVHRHLYFTLCGLIFLKKMQKITGNALEQI